MMAKRGEGPPAMVLFYMQSYTPEMIDRSGRRELTDIENLAVAAEYYKP